MRVRSSDRRSRAVAGAKIIPGASTAPSLLGLRIVDEKSAQGALLGEIGPARHHGIPQHEAVDLFLLVGDDPGECGARTAFPPRRARSGPRRARTSSADLTEANHDATRSGSVSSPAESPVPS